MTRELIAHVSRDVRHSLRGIRRRPGFAATIVITLALAVGVNTAVFAVVRDVVLNPLPFPDAERLTLLWKTTPAKPDDRSGVSPSDFRDIQRETRAFSSVAAFTNTAFDMTGVDEPYRARGARVSGNFFVTLGARPASGRGFTAEDDRVGAAPVAIVSHALWHRVFGGDVGVVGRTVSLNGEQYSVVGVMPEDFSFPEVFGPSLVPELWTPLRLSDDELAQRGTGYMFVIGRLARSVPIDRARAELDALSRRFEIDGRTEYAGRRLTLVSLGEQVVGSVRNALLVLWGAVACVLVIGCANLANMLLARATAEGRELAVRVSLGASRARLIGQRVTEGVVLSVSGGALGIVLAAAVTHVLPRLGLMGLPRLNEVSVDAGVLAFGFALSIATGVVLGAVPAWQVAVTDSRHALQGARRTLGAGSRASRLRGILVVVQVQIAVVLVVGAGLLVRSFAELRRVDLGVQPDNVLTLEISLPQSKYDRAARPRVFEQILERLAARPEIQAAGAISYLPLAGNVFSWGFHIEHRALTPDAAMPTAEYRVITPALHSALGMTMMQGRGFTGQDAAHAVPVAIINAAMARRYWPGEGPIGKRLRLNGPVTDYPWVTIVGVAKDVRFGGVDQAAPPTIYRPLSQFPLGTMSLVLRTNGAPLRAVSAVRDVVREFDRDLAVFNVRELSSLVSASLALRRGLLMLLGGFGVLALVLSMLGIYGVTAYMVTQRVPEIGLRMALGAPRRSVFALVMVEGGRMALLGLIAGVALALVLSRTMASLVYGVAPTDPLTLGAVCLLLLVAVLTATWFPARRAVRVDPMVALRAD